MEQILTNLLRFTQIPESFYPVITALISLLLVAALAFIVYALARILIKTLILGITRRTSNNFDDILYDSGVYVQLARILPPIVFVFLSPVLLNKSSIVLTFILKVSGAWILIASSIAIGSVLDAINSLYKRYNPEVAKKKPIKGYLQMLKIFIWIVALILVLTSLANVSPVGILSGFGAMSAVLMLIFKDPIMGLVSSLQLTANDLVRIGDWIEMPKYGADGDVIEITLQSILVQNWDKTITSIPIYALISDSFKNWRGMSEGDGRRIKRTLFIDMKTVRFLENTDEKRLGELKLLAPYLSEKAVEIEKWNDARGIQDGDRANGRHLTNLGTFRAYVSAYLLNHPHVNTKMTCMVRYLEAGAQGLPLEIYLFSADKNWVAFEGIQADIIDHLLAIMGEFDLRIFQAPSGWDVSAAVESVTAATALSAGASNAESGPGALGSRDIDYL